MKGSMDYFLGQALSLIFYIMTLMVYNRARKEYGGGKIAAAIKLIMLFLAVLLLTDFVDYFFAILFPLRPDSILILKILLKLTALCVLFFGGLRFFIKREIHVRSPASAAPSRQAPVPASPASVPERTAILPGGQRRLPTLGRYEILSQIGRGAMGVVYKGRDPKLNRLTAIKTIRFIDDFDQEQAERVKAQFYHEAEVVAKLSHPNIVTIYDVGEDFDLSYLAMEYLDGRNLEHFTRRENLPDLRTSIDFIAQVCDALDYAHRHDIVHRDIKPENIMVLGDGTVKVTDFGIARIATSTRTRTGVIKGTPYYMSPEQTKGLKLSGPSDLFSLGVVFYQLLTGRLPFTGENMAAIMFQTTSVDPEPASRYNPDVDDETEAVLERALAKDLALRYATAAEMGAALRRRLQALPAKGLDEGPPPKGIAVPPQSGAFREPPEAGPVAGKPAASGEAGIVFEGQRLEMERPPTAFDRRADERAAFTADLVGGLSRRGGHDELLRPDERPSRPSRDLFGRLTTLVLGASVLIIALSAGYYFFFRTATPQPPAAPLPSAAQQALLEKIKQEKAQVEAQLAEVQRQKQAEQERLARLEAEKQAEEERLARIEQERVAREKEAEARMRQAQQAAQARAARLEAQQQAEQERLTRIANERRETLRTAALQALDQELKLAQQALADEDYSAARQQYRQALEALDASAFKDEARFLDYRRQIQEALASDDIVYGAQGYVKYKARWLSPQQYEAALYDDGYVRYQGRIIPHSDLSTEIRKRAKARVRAFVDSKYAGQRVHTKNIKFQGLRLQSSTAAGAHYSLAYRWEVWTLNELGTGTCAVDVRYDVPTDAWQLSDDCR